MAGVEQKVNEFNRALEAAIAREVDERVKRKLLAGVRAAYNYIMEVWPKQTYYSAANNRISITGRDIARVEPRERPTQPGALAEKFVHTWNTELAKLDRLETEMIARFGAPAKQKRNRVIVLGNAVDYAEDVSYEPGKGRAIYNEAALIASATMRRTG